MDLASLRTVELYRPWRSRLVGIAAAGATVAASWAAFEQTPTRLPAWEATLFTSVNSWPDSLRPVLWPVMQLGNFWMTAIGAGGAYLVWRRPAPAITAAGSTLGAWAVAKVVKNMADRGRPSDLLAPVHIREDGINGLGFVSGHAAVAFALATALSPWLPRPLRVVAFGLATAVGASRLYVGAHLPLDIVGGGAIGVMCGLTMHLVIGCPAPTPAGRT